MRRRSLTYITQIPRPSKTPVYWILLGPATRQWGPLEKSIIQTGGCNLDLSIPGFLISLISTIGGRVGAEVVGCIVNIATSPFWPLRTTLFRYRRHTYKIDIR